MLHMWYILYKWKVIKMFSAYSYKQNNTVLEDFNYCTFLHFIRGSGTAIECIVQAEMRIIKR